MGIFVGNHGAMLPIAGHTRAPIPTIEPRAQKLNVQRAAAEKIAEERVMDARQKSMTVDSTKNQAREAQANSTNDSANPTKEIKISMGEEEVSRKNSRSVFVIHGRNSQLTESLGTFLRSINLKPIEFSVAIQKTIEHERKGGNPFIGSILDHVFEDAAALIVLFSPDD
jgi:hypothetical protein